MASDDRELIALWNRAERECAKTMDLVDRSAAKLQSAKDRFSGSFDAELILTTRELIAQSSALIQKARQSSFAIKQRAVGRVQN